MRVYEAELTDRCVGTLIALSEQWAAEGSCWGYRANSRADIEGNRVFLAEGDEGVLGYLFGHGSAAKKASSVMPEGTPYFEVEEIYVLPEARSRGIGRALFRYAEDAVRGEAEYVMLSTATKNWRAILHFYVDELGMDFWNARLFKRIE